MLRWCVVAVGIALTSVALAGPFEDGIAAAYRGDYGTAARLWRPLAESGVAIAQNNLGALYARGWASSRAASSSASDAISGSLISACGTASSVARRLAR